MHMELSYLPLKFASGLSQEPTICHATKKIARIIWRKEEEEKKAHSHNLPTCKNAGRNICVRECENSSSYFINSYFSPLSIREEQSLATAPAICREKMEHLKNSETQFRFASRWNSPSEVEGMSVEIKKPPGMNQKYAFIPIGIG